MLFVQTISFVFIGKLGDPEVIALSKGREVVLVVGLRFHFILTAWREKEVHRLPKFEEPKREIWYTITLGSRLQVDKRACNLYDLDDLNSPLSLLDILWAIANLHAL
jgi:hypothetical protein